MDEEEKSQISEETKHKLTERLRDQSEGDDYLKLKRSADDLRIKKMKKTGTQEKSIWPTVIDLQQYERRKYYPESYYTNTKKENLLLWLANKFREICSKLDPQRRLIILSAENECRIQKMVCTTIRPTKIKYHEFYTWHGCAQFIADHIEYQQLEKPVIFPEFIRSPDTVLERQRANSFEMAILLVSCLIGSGYDAYVVSGTATREVCTNDQTRVKCPYIPKEEIVHEQTEQKKEKKYIPKPPPDFSSSFQKMMTERMLKKAADLERKAQEEERQRIAELEKPKPDEIYGLRRHSWVLILNGSRGIHQTFYIEPTTGLGIPTDDPRYLSVDSIWNSNNYWFALKSKKPQNFDLSDEGEWKKFLTDHTFRDYMEGEENHNLDYNDTVLARKHMDVITSWVRQLKIQFKNYQERYPNGSKQTLYYKARSQLYAAYNQNDGLVQRITLFSDYEYRQKTFEYELFKNRQDRLIKIETDARSGTVIEYFAKGRTDSLEQYQHKKDESTPMTDMTLKFYHSACYDSLSKITIKSNLMSIEYMDREDLLHCKYCEFLTADGAGFQAKNIVKVKEVFDKDSTSEQQRQVAMREFNVKGDKIQIKYHHSKGKLVSSVKNFQKIQTAEGSNEITFHPNLYSGYEFDPSTENDEDLKALFKNSLLAEKQAIADIQMNLNKIERFLQMREKERTAPQLRVSIYDPLRNDRMNREMKKKEEVDKFKTKNEIEGELDYFLPYFVKFEKRKLDFGEALQLYRRCLSDFKNLQLKRAMSLQDKMNGLNQELAKKQKDFDNGEFVDQKDGEELSAEILQLRHQIEILEVRIARHERLSTQRYQMLEERLSADPRLQVLKDANQQSATMKKNLQE